MSTQPDISILIVSFNTRELTRECLESVREECVGISAEIAVIDNASRDGSAEMIERDFPEVLLTRSPVNLGFGNANNRIMTQARGRYVVLLNTDAFFKKGSLRRLLNHMDETPACGAAGGLLVGRDGQPQPSARAFHSLWNDAAVLTGLAAKFPGTVFGRLDRTNTDQSVPAIVDWVTGAMMILRPEALSASGVFDPAFFLYYEEVDLCRRMHAAGWQVWYWPDVVVTHIGGESSRTLTALDFSSTAAQVVKWRMRSTFLYYRKHHGVLGAGGALALEAVLYTVSRWRNRLSRNPERHERGKQFHTLRRLLLRAWQETHGGRQSPVQPW